jgi:sec-independent protein translocase protein TatA
MGFPNIGPGELILILIIALVVLGPGKLPDVASSLGKSVREFRRAATDVSEAGKLDAPPQSAAQAPPQSAAQALPPTVASAPVPHVPAASAQLTPPTDPGPEATPGSAADHDRPPTPDPNAGGPARDSTVS